MKFYVPMLKTYPKLITLQLFRNRFSNRAFLIVWHRYETIQPFCKHPIIHYIKLRVQMQWKRYQFDKHQLQCITIQWKIIHPVLVVNRAVHVQHHLLLPTYQVSITATIQHRKQMTSGNRKVHAYSFYFRINFYFVLFI